MQKNVKFYQKEKYLHPEWYKKHNLLNGDK